MDMLPSEHSNTRIAYQKGNHYASINYICILCIGWVVEPSGSAISGKTCRCQVEHRLGPVHSKIPTYLCIWTTASSERYKSTLPVFTLCPVLWWGGGCISCSPCSSGSPPLLLSLGTAGIGGNKWHSEYNKWLRRCWSSTWPSLQCSESDLAKWDMEAGRNFQYRKCFLSLWLFSFFLDV